MICLNTVYIPGLNMNQQVHQVSAQRGLCTCLNVSQVVNDFISLIKQLSTLLRFSGLEIKIFYKCDEMLFTDVDHRERRKQTRCSDKNVYCLPQKAEIAAECPF